MLSDEEKKAIERIEDLFYQDLGKGINKFQKITLYEDSITDIRKLLNLIEKQSKEIEEINKSDASKEQSSMNYYNLYKELVDKIKAEIEELEKQDREDRMSHNYLVIPVLQSLLEKE